MAKDLDVAAAQEKAGPKPVTSQQHLWNTEEEYQAQISMPCHLVGDDLFLAGTDTDLREGDPYRKTLCGKRVGGELLRTTDVAEDVTCAACKRKRTNLAKKKVKR